MRANLGAIAIGALVAAACSDDGSLDYVPGPDLPPGASSAPAPRSPNPPQATAKKEPEAAPPCLRQVLDADRVFYESPARRTLYTWLSSEQLASVRAAKHLFAGAEKAPAASAVFAHLAVIAGRDLAGDRFAATRSTWPLAWATRMTAKGHELVRITLREDAIVIVSRAGVLRAFDAANHDVGIATVIGQPERIGAIYFEQDELGRTPCGVVSCPTIDGYREVLVGNEAMIEEWSYGTEPVHAERARERGLLADLLAGARETLPPSASATWNASVVDSWSISPTQRACSATESYAYTLAIPNADYAPTARNLARLIDTLDTDPAPGEPLVVHPTKEAK